jgi:hypothetical protein
MVLEEGLRLLDEAATKRRMIPDPNSGPCVSLPSSEKVCASLAVADGRLFIRGETNLFCIGR